MLKEAAAGLPVDPSRIEVRILCIKKMKMRFPF